MLALTTVLQQDLGIHYNPERMQYPSQPLEPNNTFFANSRDVFIHGLVKRHGMGTCSSMPVLYVSVGRRLGYPLKLVRAKAHLFARWVESGKTFNIEGTSQGFISHPDSHYWNFPISFTPAEAEGYLKSMTAAQELSVFLSIRGLCLQAAGDYKKALGAFAHAFYKHPQSIANQILLTRAEQLAVQTGSMPRKHTIMMRLNDLVIPEGPQKQILLEQKSAIQSMILTGASEAIIETKFSAFSTQLDGRIDNLGKPFSDDPENAQNAQKY